MPWNEDEDFDDDFDEPELALPDTRLQVQGDRLLRLNEDGSTIMSIGLRSIVSVRFGYKFDPFSFVFAAIAGGLVALGKYATDGNWLGCILYVLAVPVAFIFVVGIFEKTITIQQEDGSLDITCSESKDQLQGFVISLREILSDRRS